MSTTNSLLSNSPCWRLLFGCRATQLRRRSTRHVSKVHSQLAESSMANRSVSRPGNAPKYHSAAMVGATNRRSIKSGKDKALRMETATHDIEHAKPCNPRRDETKRCTRLRGQRP